MFKQLRHGAVLLSTLALAACGDSSSTSSPPGGPPIEEGQTTAEQRAMILTRASLDLRGQRPSAQDLERVEDDPAALDGLLDGYLQDDAFGHRVRDIFAVSYRMRTESYFHPLDEDEGGGVDYQLSVAEEPLKLLEHLATHDLPYDKLVKADYTFVNETLAEIWPVRGYRPEVGGWQKVRYRDGRPAAGVLSTNGFYFRYTTNEANLARSRANAVSRVLLCDNYLLRPIDFPRNIDLTDEEGIANAIENNAACASCHDTLDPLASYFFAFGGSDEDPKPVYTPQYADLWQETTGKAPSYYGQDGEDVSDLGQQIANDPRFAACAARRVYEGLMGRPTTAADQSALNQHTQAFKDGGMTLRALFRSVMSDPLYRGQDDGQRLAVERKLMSPEVLSDAVAALTGHRLTVEGIDFLRSDNILHTLGGGLSAHSGDFPPTTSNVTRTLVQARVAEAAAWAQIDNEESTEALFGEIDLEDDTPDVDGFVRLHRVVLGMKLDEDAPEIAESVALWHDLVEKADLEPREAWAGVLTALLRDPRFVMY